MLPNKMKDKAKDKYYACCFCDYLIPYNTFSIKNILLDSGYTICCYCIRENEITKNRMQE